MNLTRRCPKCQGLAWLEEVDRVVALSCSRCGALKFVQRITEDGMLIYNRETPTQTTMPRNGSKLHSCLSMLVANAPIRTGDLAEMLEQTTSDTATQLAMLGVRGLVSILENRKGISGGSVWGPTRIALKILM